MSAPAGIDCGGACSHAFDKGASVTLTAVAATGSRFAGWDGACKSAGTASNCAVVLAADQQVAAAFDIGPTSAPPGPTKPLKPVTRRSRCTPRGPLPDRDCTPGAIAVAVTDPDTCTLKNDAVPTSAAKSAFARYGIRLALRGRYVVDQLVPLGLGGTNDQANVWPELKALAQKKNRIEGLLQAQVCAGVVSLAEAQQRIAVNWPSAYRFGP
jgi:hypothetical protein